jgi:hypothetical protein
MFTSNIVSFKTIYQAVLILVALMILADIPQAEGTDRRPGFGGEPTPVNVFIFVFDLDEVKTADQSFVANVFLEYRWQDPRLAHQDETDRVRPLHDVWNPRLLLINQQRVLKTIPELVSIAPNGEVTYRQRLWGTFSQPLNLIDFPFDKQQFKIQLAAIGYNMKEIELRPNPQGRMGIAELSVTDWNILDWQAGAAPYKLIPGNDTALPGFSFSFEAERKSEYFVVKVILPLILIVAMSWIVFWIDPKESGIQISVAITTMLTLIAYRFAVGADLPKVSYLTRLDFFILSATILVFASLIEVVVTSTLAGQEKLELARKLDRWSRWLFPAIFSLFTLKSFI